MLLKPRGEARSFVGRGFRAFNRWFDRMTGGYVSINRMLIRKLAIPLILLLGVTGGAVLIGKDLPSGFVPEEDQGYALVGIQLPDAASLQRTSQVAAQMDAAMADMEDVKQRTIISGFSFFTRTAASYVGMAFISLKPWEERKGKGHHAKDVVQELNKRFSKIPGARLFALNPPAIPGMSAAGGFSMMLQDKSGGSVDFLAQNVGKFLAAASKRPELAGVRPNFSPGVPQIFAEVDKEKALKQGVPLTEVYGALQTFLGGSYVNDFTRFGRQWRVFTQAAPEYRQGVEDLREFYVRNVRGEMVPLSTLVNARTTYGPEFTNRFNLYRSAEIMGMAAPGYSSGQALAALEEVAAQTLPSEMGYAWNALSYQEKSSQGGQTKVLGLSLLFVFLILAALYESWSLPFSVLLSVPVAILGAFLGLASKHLDNNVYAQIGLVMLVGLTAKNAILIVEFAKARLEEGKPLVEAALEGARLRLRPILMTSFAFIFGCVPLVVAEGAGAGGRQVMGIVVVCGMTAATLLGIFFIPSLFVAFERLSGHKDRAPEERPRTSEAPPRLSESHAE
jgi:HAE1 family hydrophobic/amphiphilic exporter-1